MYQNQDSKILAKLELLLLAVIFLDIFVCEIQNLKITFWDLKFDI